MPTGPFPPRSESPWAELNKVVGPCGKDAFFAAGETSDAPLPLGEAILSGDLSTAPQEVDLLIVGAGLSGAVLAERCSKELGLTSLIIEKRDHIGGNVYDYVDANNIRVSQYGAHLFHTKYERVWDYVTEFSEWIPYDHRVRGLVPDKDGNLKLVAIPPVQSTVNALFGENISSEEEMQKWYEGQRVPPAEEGKLANSEEAALSRVPCAVREDLQALHEEAVGQVPLGTRRVCDAETPLSNVHRRKIFPGRVAGVAHARIHKDL